MNLWFLCFLKKINVDFLFLVELYCKFSNNLKSCLFQIRTESNPISFQYFAETKNYNFSHKIIVLYLIAFCLSYKRNIKDLLLKK